MQVPVAHRDVKPANILLTSAGDLKLADLGLARALDVLKGDSVMSAASTNSGSKGAAGTYAYMPPEALANPPLRTLTGDIWSVGVVALQLASPEANLGSSPIGLGDLATVTRQVEARLPFVSGSVSQPYLEAVRLMLTFAHAERATASELLCETAFYAAAAKLGTAKPTLVELQSLEMDAKLLAGKKQAAEAKAKAAADAQALVAAEAEEARVRAGGCAAGAEHEWQWHTGTDGTGRACFKCLEVQDYAKSEMVWSCASVDERNRVLAGGCPSRSLRRYGGLGGGPVGHPPLDHAWEQGSEMAKDGEKGSGRMCTRCGQTEDSSGKMILLPQLVGGFGPVKVNPRLAGR